MKTTLHDWLPLQAERRPEAIAVAYRGESVTYEALEAAANRLARGLKLAGCAPGDRVGLLIPKSPSALVAMFGSLKAGCIYVPLDVSSPRHRLERILGQCECRCVLAEQDSAALLRELIAGEAWRPATSVIWTDSGADLPESTAPRFSKLDTERLPAGHVDSGSSSSDPAHILFTSGSTGTPKGVVITHANIIRFVRWAIRYFGIEAGDRISGHPPLHFDLSTFDIYGTIAAGAQLHMLPPEMNLLPHRMASFIRDFGLTQWFSVPSALHNMARHDVVRWNDFPSLKRLLWCGEAFATPDLRYWMQRVPHATFVNLYGPTETTIASSYYRVPACPADDREEIPIGAPCAGESLMVLDDSLNPTQPGEIGSLYIAGAGLSPGYWRDPNKTAEVFVSNPYAASPGERMYKTGDLARITGDGQIYLIGRADSQIKSRGYRIELGEIEAAIGTFSGVRDSAVVAVDSPGEDGKLICCAFVPAAGLNGSASALKQHLARELPRYMIPHRWMTLTDMPRNGNGKTDRPLLKQWFLEGDEGEPDAVQPQRVAASTHAR